jgi:nitroreductase
MPTPTIVSNRIVQRPLDLTDFRLRKLVELALLAPSSHNTQPWQFEVCRGTLEMRADRTRRLPVVDPDDRALVISCGAALGFLRVAIAATGNEPLVERLPDPADPDLLARVRLGPPQVLGEADAALISAMRERHTNRQEFDPTPVPELVLRELARAVRADGAWLRIVTDLDEKNALADLISEGDRIQAADAAFRRELAEWVHPNRSHSRDGMPGAVHGAGNLASLMAPWIIRSFDWGNGQAAKDRQLAAGSPALLLIGTHADEPAVWLRTGEALGRMLLVATRHGLAASFLNQPIEVPALRPAISRTLGLSGMPQLLLRVGYGPPAAATPRRPVDEVLMDCTPPLRRG